MTTLAIGQEVVVAPEALDDAGAGRCQLEGDTLHVSGALPGEEVRALIEHRSPHRHAAGGRQLFGRTLRVLRSSEARVTPACPGHGQCGGCLLQHLAYPEQLVWKRQQVAAAMSAWPALAGVEVEACVPSPRILGYRNQAKYVYGPAGADADGRARGALTFGAYAPRSHRIVDLIGCAVVEPAIDQAARAVLEVVRARQLPPFDEVRRTGSLRYLVLRSSAAGRVLCTLITGGRPLEGGQVLAAELMARAPQVVGVVENQNDSAGNVIFGARERLLAGEGTLADQVAGVPVRFGPRAFFQLNRGVAELAYSAIQAAAEERGPLARVVDLFAGMGSISFALHDGRRQITAVEENATATAAGAQAATAAGLKGIRFVTGLAAADPQLLAGADLVVLNPPRAGAAAVVPAVLAAQPRAVVYLSCNPVSLARDLAALLAPGKIRLRRLQPFDMLPHTPHVEVLAVLESA